MIDFIEKAFLFLGAGLGLIIVLILWGLLIMVVFQEIIHIFKPDKNEQTEDKHPWEVNEWERYE